MTARVRRNPLRRVRRKIERTARERHDRWRDRRGAGLDAGDFVERTGLRPGRELFTSLATFPGPAELPVIEGVVRDAARPSAEQARDHQFDILGSGPTHLLDPDASRADRIRSLAPDLPAPAAERYVPIDWHSDFRAGYRWDPDLYYLDVRIAPRPFADIKVPRELSRFQQVGDLALGGGEWASIEFLLQVADWIDANPPRRGVNWASPMDVAIRAVNWIWGLRLFSSVLGRYPQTVWHIRRSLYEHGRHLERTLEYYEGCTGNHYLADVAGLLYIGAECPEFPESDRWVLFGLQELVSEMGRQVQADGSDFESSTHYHRLVAETFLSCAALGERLGDERRLRLRGASTAGHRARPPLRGWQESGLDLRPGARVLPQAFYDRLALMAEFTAALTKPNGLVPQFGDNDSARLHRLTPVRDGDPRDHRHLLAVAGELLDRPDLSQAGAACQFEAALVAGDLRGRICVPLPSGRSAVRHFPDAGIVVARRGPAFLAVTCGQNGQHGLGGHGHNDKLSFELNIDGRDFIVDGGCPAYTGDPVVRNRYRSTWAHSTLALAGLEQDRWRDGLDGLFRLAERSRPRFLRVTDGETVEIEGEHHGYGAPHRRVFRLDDRRVRIDDRFESSDLGTLVLNLDPQVTCRGPLEGHEGHVLEIVHRTGGSVLVRFEGVQRPIVVDGRFSLGYGRPVPSRAIHAVRAAGHTQFTIEWRRA